MTAPSIIDPAQFLHEHLASASPDLLQVGPLGVVEVQDARHGVEDIGGHAVEVAFLQADVPVGAHPGQHGDLFAAQTRDAAFTTAPPRCRSTVAPHD